MIPQIKVRLNLHINSTLMSHQMVFTFCAHILNSYIAHFKFIYSDYFGQSNESNALDRN